MKKEGDKGKAFCESCGPVSITYRLKDVPFSDNSGTVEDVLAGVCDVCGQVVSIPRQETEKIKRWPLPFFRTEYDE